MQHQHIHKETINTYHHIDYNKVELPCWGMDSDLYVATSKYVQKIIPSNLHLCIVAANVRFYLSCTRDNNESAAVLHNTLGCLREVTFELFSATQVIQH